MSIFDDISQSIPIGIRDLEFWQKFSELMQYIVDRSVEELDDVKLKYRGPDVVREEVIKNVIIEFGFEYIKDIMDTMTNFTFNDFLHYIALVNLLKGHRDGLELILTLLGFEYIIEEWWETTPKKTPMSYDIIIIMDSTFVPDVFNTLRKCRIFLRNYVLPYLGAIDFRYFLPEFATRNTNMAGFIKQTEPGSWRRRYIP